MNPIASIFPAKDVEKKQIIHLDLFDMEILSVGFGNFVWILIGLLTIAVGILGICLLLQ